MAESFQFSLDNSQFLAGIKGMNSAVSGLITKVGGLAAAFFSFRALLNAMPEVGQVFSFVGEVFMTNLVIPIRRMLIPYLQQLANWATRNRLLFVQIGAVLANVFKVVIQVIGHIIKLFGILFDSVSKTLGRVFGKSMQSISDLMNLIIAKIAVVFAFLAQMLEPVMEVVGVVIGAMIIASQALWEGLFKGISSMVGWIVEAFDDVGKEWAKFSKAVGLDGDWLTRVLNGIRDAFMWIGNIIGKIIGAVVALWGKYLAGIIKGIGNFIQPIIDGAKKLWDSIKKLGQAFSDLFGGAEGGKSIMQWLMDAFKFIGEVIGTIIGAGLTVVLWVIEKIVAVLTGIVKGVKWFIGGVKDVFDAIGKGIEWVYEKIIKPIFEGIKEVVAWIEKAANKIASFFTLDLSGVKLLKELQDKGISVSTDLKQGIFRNDPASIAQGRQLLNSNVNSGNNVNITVNGAGNPGAVANNVYNFMPFGQQRRKEGF